MHSVGAVIISAGSTPRKNAFDPLQKIGSISVAQRLLMTFHLAGVAPVAVVADVEDHDQLSKLQAHVDVCLVKSGGAETDMLYNAKLGLARLAPDCDRILVTPVNIPLFSVETVHLLLADGHRLASPVWEGKPGHPLLIGREHIPAILDYQGPDGLRGAVRYLHEKKVLVETDDPGVYVRSNQFEECEKLLLSHNKSQWRPMARIRIAKETPFLGPGSWQLLSLIETSGSVRLACEEMGISYSKAWKILNALEEQVGYHVLTRKHGGKKGGETRLTEEGKALLRQFERFERECVHAIQEIFTKHYGS